MNVMTGKRMLETLQRIFLEMDEMGRPMADVVSCPHGDMPRPQFDTTLTYMGRTLDFCVDCHGLVVKEFDGLNEGLVKPRSEYQKRARAFMDSYSHSGVGDRWPRLDPDLCPDLGLFKTNCFNRK